MGDERKRNHKLCMLYKPVNKPLPMPSKTTVILPLKPKRLQIDLALQGGGAHGAFTWGVLDRLLEDDHFEIAGVSGASAGAMNAVVLASGLMAGGRSGAQAALRQFWERVGANAPFSGLHAALPQPIASVAQQWWQLAVQPWMQPWQQMAQRWASSLSPYQFNPLNLNPLRDILRDTVDFDRVHACDKVLLFIAATEVRTGHLRLFREHELNADAVLASACLPLLFQAVKIDGEAYWDGGYAGNPSLMPLIQTSPADDLVLVQINPTLREEVPVSAPDILERINEISFNASLLKELRTLLLLKRAIGCVPVPPGGDPLLARLQALRLHRIAPTEPLAGLGSSTKLRTDTAFLRDLAQRGRDTADLWLAQHGADLGVRSSFDAQLECLP